MNNYLNLGITGLCAIVPNGNEVVIFLPNARDFDADGDLIDSSAIQDIHYPMLAVPSTPPPITTRTPAFVIPQGTLAGIELNAYALDGEDIVLPQVVASPVKLPPPVKGPCPSNKELQTHFGWTANVREVTNAPLLSVVTDQPLPPESLGLARLRVTNGTFATTQLAQGPLKKGQSPVILQWAYDDMQGHRMDNPRAIADLVTIQIPINVDSLVFHCTDGDITLPSDGADIEAYLVNIPIPALLGSPRTVRIPEMHFGHYYRLVGAHSEYIPTPNGTKCALLSTEGDFQPQFLTELVPHCPPARF